MAALFLLVSGTASCVVREGSPPQPLVEPADEEEAAAWPGQVATGQVATGQAAKG